MADLTYSVLIDLATQGGIQSQHLSALNQYNDKLSGSGYAVRSLIGDTMRLGRGMIDTFTGAVEWAGRLAEKLAFAGLAGAVGAVGFSITKLDEQLETLQIGVAGAFMAQGVTNNMNLALSRSGILVNELRHDAEALPVTFNQLADVFRRSLVPGLEAGTSVGKIKELSKLATVVGAATGIGTETTGRELGMLLAGRATVRSPLAVMLGLTGAEGKAFNQLSGGERVTELTKRLEGWAPAIDKYRTSFVGLFTTLKTNVLFFAQEATSPLFEAIKGSMRDLNSWFANNKGEMSTWAGYIGSRLAMAFDFVKTKIIEWGPPIKKFVTDAFDRIYELWSGISGTIGGIFNSIKESMLNGELLSKIEMILKLYVAAKAGGGLMGMMPSPGSIMGIMGMGGMGGMGGAAAGLGMGALAALPAVIGGLLGAGGLMAAMNDPNAPVRAREASNAVDNLGKSMNGLISTVTRSGGALDLLESAATHSATVFSNSLFEAETAIRMFTSRIPGWQRNLDAVFHGSFFEHLHGNEVLVHTRSGVGDQTDEERRKALQNAGVHIGQVIFNISGNQDPSRIARVAEEHLADLARHRRTSPRVPNWSSKQPAQ